MITVKIGTVAWAKAIIHSPPLRMVPVDLVLEPDREAGIVDQVEDRQVEEVAEVDVAAQLVAAVGGQRAAVHVPAVGGDDAHRMAGEAHEAGDLVGAPERPDLEEESLSAIRRMARRMSKVVGALARDDREELVLAPVGRIVAWASTGGAS